MAGDPRDTPAMRQYYAFKREYPGCVLLFRMGDFYEMFDDDAVAVSKAIGLTLTQRTEGVPMAGLPYHQKDAYIRRLIDAGFRVAIADQVQDPKEAKGVIERAVTGVVTPGTLTDDGLLSSDAVSTLAAVCFTDSGDHSPASVAVADLCGGGFTLFDTDAASLADELLRRGVGELLYVETATGDPPPRILRVLDALDLAGTPRPAWHFRPDEAREAIYKQFSVATLDGFGLRADDPAIQPAGAIVRYLQQTQTPSDSAHPSAGIVRASSLAHLSPPRRDDPRGRCIIDATSLRALEVLSTLRAESAEGSLLGVFLHASGGVAPKTPMGRRLLREWLCNPLCDIDAIRARQDAVSTLMCDPQTAGKLGESLSGVQDVSRLAARLALGRISPRDLVALGRSVGRVTRLADLVDNAPALAPHRARLLGVAAAIAPLAVMIAESCVDDPPGHMREGGLIRAGVDAALDEARSLKSDGATWLAEYQGTLISRHDLPSLKVGYNKVFGYFIELPAAQARRAPAEFSRRQTLKNAERYITQELKEFEDKVSTADARAFEREQLLFADLCEAAAATIGQLKLYADAVAELDVLLCFAGKASALAGSGRAWTRPEIVEEPVLRIEQGRHPVLDELLPTDFVPNDLFLGGARAGAASPPDETDAASLALITGPNMAGKSTFIRQTALIVLLAHTGALVPARSAVIGLADRIFTRVGADDALHRGQSTFMVEMTETARILHHATARSLVILDEIGRGTSTLDGLSLAWAIAETLAGAGADAGPRTLFATHYHELTRLDEQLPGRVRNLHVEVREWGDDIVFMHRIRPGRADRSYGIHVAKLAGIPAATTARAQQLLESLAVHHGPLAEGSAGAPGADNGRSRRDAAPSKPSAAGQLSLFTEYVSHPAVDELREMKMESLTPLAAFDALRKLKQLTAEAVKPD